MAGRKFYGIAEIAEALQQDPATVAQWRHRGKLPEPDGLLKMGPVWTAETLGPWLAFVAQTLRTPRSS